jgi:hypothetical protein
MLKVGHVREQAFRQRNNCIRVQCKVLQQRGVVKQILGQRCDASGYVAHILELVEISASECSDQERTKCRAMNERVKRVLVGDLRESTLVWQQRPSIPNGVHSNALECFVLHRRGTQAASSYRSGSKVRHSVAMCGQRLLLCDQSMREKAWRMERRRCERRILLAGAAGKLAGAIRLRQARPSRACTTH